MATSPQVETSRDRYVAASSGVALSDRSHIVRIRADGADVLDLLNRLSTNNLVALEPGMMMGTVLTTSKGRIIDLIFVAQMPDHVLLLASPHAAEKVLENIDFFIFSEDVSLRDVTGETAMIGLLGPDAAKLLGDVTGADLKTNESTLAQIAGVEAIIIRSDFAGVTGFDIIVESSSAEAVRREFLAKGKALGILKVGTEDLNTVRVEHGIPLSGQDMSDANNPLEANLKDNYISFNKGCYVGQEVVARLDTYNKVQKYLMGLRSADNSPIPEGAKLYLDGKKVGDVTSAVCSPKFGEIAIGYVRKAQATAGTELLVGAPDGGAKAFVENLPFGQG